MPDPYIYIICLFILLFLSAFFSASETAFTSMSVIRMKNLAKNKRSARIALKLRDNYDRLITTILIGNNIVNIVGTTIATIVFVNYYTNIGATLGTVIVTLAVPLPHTGCPIVIEPAVVGISFVVTVVSFVETFPALSCVSTFIVYVVPCVNPVKS